ncbi:MAG TPA: hypothetical protein VES66_07795 [Terriglobales bacterium]|nr:hypothetical protein [Terriglobales bacterium]
MVLGLAACGGGSGTHTSGLSNRAFVSDDFDGTLHIENAARDMEPGFTIATGSKPGTMVLSRDKSITLVFDSGDESLAVVSNSSESVLGRITLPNICPATPPTPCMSYVSMSDNTVGFVAVPNCPPGSCSGNTNIVNVVDVVDLKTTFNVTGTINKDSATGQPLNATTTLVLSPTGNKLLVFGSPGEHVDTMVVIDTTTAKTTPGMAATQLGAADCVKASLPKNCFDRPVSAVFSTDGNTAYVFNCGPECQGMTASVTVLNVAGTSPAPTNYIPFPATAAATVGLLSGSTLFVAGTPSGTPGTLAGQLSVLDTTKLATPASSVPISDGYHNHMELASNNKLFIGAIICSAGCLTIFDTSANKATVDSNTGDVTGIAPITGRNVVYVVENLVAGSFLGLGELRIYDTTASVPTVTPTQIDVVGRAVDVKYVDQ